MRVRVVRIADSPLVPLFEVLERPSSWERSVRATVEDESERPRFYREFWVYYAKQYPNDGVSAGHKLSHFDIWIESAELNVTAGAARGAVSVWVRSRKGELATTVRERIQS